MSDNLPPGLDPRIRSEYLMPFGGVEPGVVLDALHFAALHRASAKLATLYAGRGFVPAGPCYAVVRHQIARAAILAIPFGLLAMLIATLGRGAVPVAIFLGAIALLGLLALIPGIYNATPRTPQAALHIFYALIQSGSFNEAFERVVQCNRDDFPMRVVDVPVFGKPSETAHLDAQAFMRYWQSLLGVNEAPWVQIRTHGFDVRDLGHNLFGVDFNIEFVIRDKRWLWLLLLGLLPGYALALILSYWTSVRIRGRLHKLVYRLGGEYQLFNGEFQGAEEFDLSWLGPRYRAR